MAASKPDLTLDHIKSALSDKFGAPHGVCADPDAEPDGSIHSTVATILMDVEQRTMQVAVRPYTEHTYVQYELDAP